MQIMIPGQAHVTMSSREIADLVEARHDSVKRTIERLAERGTIVQPPSVDEQDTDAMGRQRTTSVYRLEKRDSFVVVAQLSPEFTARLVDRWQELEGQAKGQPALPDLSDPAVLTQLLIEHAGKRIEAEQRAAAAEAKVEDMQEDVAAHHRLTKADGSLNITEAAKNLGIRPRDLFDWLSHNGWIYKRANSPTWLGFQTKCNIGLLEHKTTTVLRADGSEKITEQVRITAKGLSSLAKIIHPTARLIA